MNSFTSMLMVLATLVSVSKAIDISIDKVVCDNSLPIYALDNDIEMECNGNERCTFGTQAMISGTLYYEDASNRGLVNTTGYGTADLKLMSLDYQLFNDLPIDFCGDWIKNGYYNANTCPGNGTFHFEVPYQLPPPKDITTWFATGWSGTGLLNIYSEKESDVLLASCTLHVQTYTTSSSEDGWKSMPSAAATTFGIVAAIVFLASCICCLACCRSRRRAVVTDEDADAFQKMEN